MIILSSQSRRNIVAKAARISWPGNKIPIFRGNPTNSKKLDDLVSELKRTRSTQHFGERAIRQHILDTLAE